MAVGGLDGSLAAVVALGALEFLSGRRAVESRGALCIEQRSRRTVVAQRALDGAVGAKAVAARWARDLERGALWAVARVGRVCDTDARLEHGRGVACGVCGALDVLNVLWIKVWREIATQRAPGAGWACLELASRCIETRAWGGNGAWGHGQAREVRRGAHGAVWTDIGLCESFLVACVVVSTGLLAGHGHAALVARACASDWARLALALRAKVSALAAHEAHGQGLCVVSLWDHGDGLHDDGWTEHAGRAEGGHLCEMVESDETIVERCGVALRGVCAEELVVKVVLCESVADILEAQHAAELPCAAREPDEEMLGVVCGMDCFDVSDVVELVELAEDNVGLCAVELLDAHHGDLRAGLEADKDGVEEELGERGAEKENVDGH
eukprot:comp22326_c0_seq1/m.53618 comp22326_c0_seq1/g.53618  ORF comp22326_c0_seq1/g.53618 comp22326_c0_seq1/m.53618 type:complete len:384 (-) comp22326_c0_seq1:1873-3024(-)